MKIFSLYRIFVLWLSDDQAMPDRDPANDWCRDPLSHPALQAMRLDELADLPFDRCTVCRQ
jgi:hypothetical protein